MSTNLNNVGDPNLQMLADLAASIKEQIKDIRDDGPKTAADYQKLTPAEMKAELQIAHRSLDMCKAYAKQIDFKVTEMRFAKMMEDIIVAARQADTDAEEISIVPVAAPRRVTDPRFGPRRVLTLYTNHGSRAAEAAMH